MTLTFNEATHRYRLDGRAVPNVTSIINGGLPKGALVSWAARVTAEHAVSLAVPDQPGSPPFVVDLVEHVGREGAALALAKRPDEVRNAAGARGTLVHDLSERIAHGEAVDMPNDEVAAMVAGYVLWLDDFAPDVITTETLVFSRTHWYAGKLDLIADIGGVRWLLDLKTSRSVYGDTALQLAAYAFADAMIDRDTGEETPMIPVERMGVVHITPDGTDLYDLGNIDDAHGEFVACLATYRGTQRRRPLPGRPLTPEDIGAAPMLWKSGDLS